MNAPDTIYQQSELLHTQEEIDHAIAHLAQKLSAQFRDKNPIVCCVLMGGLYTFGRLLPLLKFDFQTDALRVSRYENQDRSADLAWSLEPSLDPKERHIVLVDDIIDEGITLYELSKALTSRGAKSIHSAVLFDKQIKNHTKRPIQADFIGLAIKDRFVFGAGLDYSGYYRNLNELRAIAGS
jgi:hypoxanthine phosphoribosyltransferase